MDDHTRFHKGWHKLAGRTALKVNLGWLAQMATPGFVTAGLAGFAAILGMRSASVDMGPGTAATMAGGLILILGGALVMSARRFIRRRQALVLLEAEMGLHNALTAALDGRRAWPQTPAAAHDGLRWRWHRLLLPPLFFLGCLLAGRHMPLAEKEAAQPAVAEPQAWGQMREWIDSLRQEKAVAEEDLERVEEQLRGLAERPQKEWFSHQSLNAADELREQMRDGITRLGRNLRDAERALNALGNHADSLSETARDQMRGELAEALEQMRAGGMKPDKALLDQLSQIDPKDLKGMSKEQLDQLRDSLKSKSGVCEAPAPGFGQEKGFLGDGKGEDDAMADGRGFRDRMETGPDGKAGNGGLSRGPGTAPLTLADEESDFGTDKSEALSSRDFSKARPGTLLGVQDGRHEVDKTPAARTEAGAVRGLGQGGGQVWRESLSPEEKAVLKRVFR